MTQPDQFLPEQAANKTSFSAWASTTEDEWREQLREDTASHLSDVQTGFGNIGFDIGTTIDNIVSGLFGWIGDGFSHSESAQALADQAARTAALSAAVLGMDPDATVVDFSTRDDAATLGTDFDQTYYFSGSGTWGVEDGLAAWDSVNDAPRTCLAVYNDSSTDSDYQSVAMSMASSPVWFNQIAEGRNILMGRCNSAGDTFIYVDFGKYDIELGCFVSGVPTVWEIMPFTSFNSTGTYWLDCGTSTGSRVFRVREENTVLLEHTEVGTTSQLGASYRYTGFGASAYATFFGTSPPGKVAAWAFVDTDLGT